MEDKWAEWEQKYRSRKIISLIEKTMQNQSAKYSLDKTDLYKIGRGLLITVVATILTYIASIYANINYSITLGQGQVLNLTPFLIPLIGSGLELARRWLTNYETSDTI